MRIARPTVAIIAIFASAFSIPRAASAQVTTRASMNIEQRSTADVMQAVLSNVAVTVTVISHPGEIFGTTSGGTVEAAPAVELSTSLQLLSSTGLMTSQDAISVSIGAIAKETALDCGNVKCDNVIVVLAQYN